ncbi:uncharacterized protein LOC107433199 [Ziziphus jujuba]|uniref:Uncharacterized protein LOC107433199 n=1 Tax=Ziziphus jujuba TaxID=326968 RepID=A0ABM3I701_ZIZJJ|nr:uncharacterized protein LOC107433199 [Ziziphus jujuba]XP_060668943.1 uncharacterized protein LOC107433199 [Ziziphus jujuba]
MGVEKEGSKNGAGYVGGFFHLFDWKAKSRKKLFSSKSDLLEHSKQGKRYDSNLPTTRLHLMDEDETGAGSSIKGSTEHSCASSVTDEEGCGTRAPSVVARLMGLDTLPPSNFQEPYSTPFFDTQSLRDAHYHRKNFDYYHDHQVMYSGNMLNKMDGQNSMNFVESKPQKTISRPIEKFQTETLPPKSAKSIPITHHKLLSPIKNPGFIPTKNAAHIMEAAAKIIEPGPQATAKGKMPLVGSSSAPLKVHALKEKAEATQKVSVGSSVALKVRDLKEKVENAHRTSKPSETSRRPVESNAARYLKGQSLNKSWNGSMETPFRTFPNKEEGSSGLKNKGRSISLAIQAKVNVQRREGLNPSISRSDVGQREQGEVKSSQPFRRQPNVQKNLHKKSSSQNASGVLRQNNQKQNCLIDKDKLTSKPLVSNPQGRKLMSGDSSVGRHKTSNRSNVSSRTGSRKSGLETTDSESSTRTLPRKKRSINGDFHFNRSRGDDSTLNDKNQKPAKSNPVIDNPYSWADENRKKGIDVVSFTFTAPLARPLPSSEISSQVTQRKSSLSVDHRGKRVLLDSDGMKLSSLGYNVIGGDALSMLLEEKLRELTYGLESSSHETAKVGPASGLASHLENMIPTLDVGATPRINEQRDQHVVVKDKSGGYNFDFSSTDHAAFRFKQKFQGVDKLDEYSNGHFEAVKLDSCRHPSPVSILEPSLSNESYDSSVSTDSNSTEGSKLCSSVQAQDVHGLSFPKKLLSVEADTELSDSASSTSFGFIARKHASMISVPDPVRSIEWELAYVKEILCNVELMFKDFSLGRVRDVINPHLFNLLESRKGESDCGESRLRRKVLFDCVRECLDLRCRRYVGGGFRMWVKGVAMVGRKEWLAEEVYKEISGWKGMGDAMVDELVDKDMSSQFGRWLDFEEDEFVLGVEVEAQIFNSLIDEIVADAIQF